MKTLAASLTALFLISAPALAGGFVLDFPHLTFPDDQGAPTTRGCASPVSPGTDAGCATSK